MKHSPLKIRPQSYREQTDKGTSGSRSYLEHEFAHGLELFCGVVLSMKQRVVGHLPQLHHHITQLTLCRETRGITDQSFLPF